MTAFKQVLTNLQSGQREEAMIGLEFVLRLDPSFAPATSLKRQLAASSKEIDLGDIIAQLQAPTTDAINGLLIEAVDDFNSREFISAKEKVEKVLIDLPGHQEARELRDQIDKALKIEGQVGQFLIQARDALAKGDSQEAANFVMMAQALDPHHTGIASTLKEIDETGGLALSQETATGPVAQPAAAPGPGGRTSPPQRGSSVVDGDPEVAGAGAERESATHPDGSGNQDAFAVEFDVQDPFADLIDTAPEAPAFGAGAGDDMSFPPMDDTADLFTAPAGAAGSQEPLTPASESADSPDGSSAGGGDSVAATIQDLVARGQAAAEANDQSLAISLWSRIFLIKPSHPEAGHLIEKAKRSLADAEAQVETLLTKARDAFDEGEHEAARLLINKCLGLRPNHIDVHILKEELDREQGVAAAPPPPIPRATSAAPELPELDDDLFGDAIETAPDAAQAAAAEHDDLTHDLFHDAGERLQDFDEFQELSLVERLRSKLPVRLMAFSAIGLVVVLAGVWLGGKFLAPEPEVDDSAAVSAALVQADRLFNEHKVEEALHLLREFPATGLSGQRIEMRIAKYEESLAPPTPTPVPEHATRARSLLDQGLWWAAYATAGEGLADHPDDPGLLEIRRLVVDNEPEAPVLDKALKSRNFRTAVSITEDLLARYPGEGDLQMVLERSLFNAALAESRAYNLTGAENHLTRLLELKPEDEEAIRFLEFVQKYKVVAADMRLEIFIRSMNER